MAMPETSAIAGRDGRIETSDRTVESALLCRCPFGVAEYCVGSKCMAWRSAKNGVEVDWREKRPGETPGDSPGREWSLNYRDDRDIWIRVVPGGDCRRLSNFDDEKLRRN
jgi:hypothetical protein